MQGSLADLEAVLTDRSVCTAPGHSWGSVCPVDVTEQPVTRRSRPPQSPVVLLGGEVTLGSICAAGGHATPSGCRGCGPSSPFPGGLAGISLAAAPRNGLCVSREGVLVWAAAQGRGSSGVSTLGGRVAPVPPCQWHTDSVSSAWCQANDVRLPIPAVRSARKEMEPFARGGGPSHRHCRAAGQP